MVSFAASAASPNPAYISRNQTAQKAMGMILTMGGNIMTGATDGNL